MEICLIYHSRCGPTAHHLRTTSVLCLVAAAGISIFITLFGSWTFGWIKEHIFRVVDKLKTSLMFSKLVFYFYKPRAGVSIDLSSWFLPQSWPSDRRVHCRPCCWFAWYLSACSDLMTLWSSTRWSSGLHLPASKTSSTDSPPEWAYWHSWSCWLQAGFGGSWLEYFRLDSLLKLRWPSRELCPFFRPSSSLASLTTYSHRFVDSIVFAACETNNFKDQR